MSTESSSSKKGIIAILLIAVAAGFTYAQVKKVTPSAAINNGVTGDFGGRGGGPRGPGGPGGGGFQEIAKEANITPEQQKQLEALRNDDKMDWQERRTKMQDILTTDQRQKIRQGFQSQMAARDAKMKSAMGEAEFKRYQEKREQRMQQWRNNGTGGPRRGGNNGR